MKKFFNNKPRAWFVVGLVLVTLMTAGAVGYLYLNKEVAKNPDVIAKIGGEEIMIADFKAWLYSQDNAGTSQNPSKWEEIKNDNNLKKYYLDNFVRNKVLKKEAESQTVTVTEAEIDAKYDVPTSNYDSLTDEEKALSRENVKNAIINEKLNSQLGWVSGDYIFYRFDKYYKYGEEIAAIEGAGDSDLIAKQRSYAEDMANQAFQRLKLGTSTIESETKRLEKDPEISFAAFAPYTPHISGVTTKDEFLNGDSLFDNRAYRNLKQPVENLKQGEYSAPFVVQGRVNKDFKDIAFVIFHAKEVATGQFKDYASWYESLLSKYQVEIYYSAIGISGYEDKKIGLASFLDGVIPKAQAVCTVDYVGLHRTQFKLYTYVRNNDGVTFTLWPNAAFTLQAGLNSSSPKLQGYQNTDCSYTGNFFQAYKTASSDGYMYSARADAEGAFLADCSSTSTAAVYAHKPVSSSWVANGGVLSLSNYNNAPNWGGAAAGSGTNTISVGINMAGFNGLTLIDEFTYSPQYIRDYTLTVAKNGTGTGTVTGTDISCGSDCSQTWPESTQVTLTATPDAGSTFTSWSGGGCSGAGTCLVTMDASKTVTATFTRNAAALTCSCTPESGLSPLVVRVSASGGVPPYTFNIGEAGVAPFTNRTSPFYYTYGTSGAKTVTCTDSAATPISRTCNVTVSDPTDSDGGEVAP